MTPVKILRGTWHCPVTGSRVAYCGSVHDIRLERWRWALSVVERGKPVQWLLHWLPSHRIPISDLLHTARWVTGRLPVTPALALLEFDSHPSSFGIWSGTVCALLTYHSHPCRLRIISFDHPTLGLPTQSIQNTMNQMQAHRPDLIAALEDQGYRITAPRQAIARMLEHKKEGFTAEEIIAELPAVGRATVYRTIKLLLRAGVVCKLATMEGAPMYSLSRAEHHHHTVCVSCGAVGEFRAATVERLLRGLGDDIPGRILGHRIEFYITCDACLPVEVS